MLTTRSLLAAAKAARGIPSNYRLARALDVPERTVQRWSSGVSRPDDGHAAQLAELAGLDAGEVVASIRAERAEPGQMRDLWASVAARLHSAAMAVFLALFVGIGGGPDAPVSPMTDSPIAAAFERAGLYIMSTVNRGIAHFGRMCHDMLTSRVCPCA